MDASGRGEAGYTLLEMVVVIALIALATALVAPPGVRMIRAWQEATELSDVLEQLERLPGTVRASGHPLTLMDDVGDLPFVLPEEWALVLETPLQVLANGACSNARGRLLTRHQDIELQIQAPFCRVRRVEP